MNLFFNYYPIDCFFIESTQNELDNKDYIHLTYKGILNNPNVIFYEHGSPPSYYQSTHMYVHGKKHYHLGINYDAELIIEHSPTTTRNTKLFHVFLLSSSSSSSSSSFNDLILLSKSNKSKKLDAQLSIDMNDYLMANEQTHPYFYYETENEQKEKCKVIINPNVVKISHLEPKTQHHHLFFEKEQVQQINVITKNGGGNLPAARDETFVFKEGFYSSKISDVSNVMIWENNGKDVFECEFLPVDSETVDVYQIPIESDAITSSKMQEFSQTMIHYSFMFVVFLFVLFASPLMYNGLMENVFKGESLGWFAKKSWFFFMPEMNNKPYNYFDLFVLIAMLLIFIISLSIGYTKNNDGAKSFGIIILLTYIIGVVGIFGTNAYLNLNSTLQKPLTVPVRVNSIIQ